MSDWTAAGIERLEPLVDGAETAMQMDEEAFRAFYDRTARPVWLYLTRLTGSSQTADDLLQEAYYRFLRSDRRFESELHRRNYLFRIATNLARDVHRRQPVVLVSVPSEDGPGSLSTENDAAEQGVRRADLARAMARLKPRERAMLWLAYANGFSHEEIAASLGLKRGSIKQLLSRARGRLAALLH
jgi:RNA polymerase sigma-70 factor (ECF subfamily)